MMAKHMPIIAIEPDAADPEDFPVTVEKFRGHREIPGTPQKFRGHQKFRAEIPGTQKFRGHHRNSGDTILNSTLSA
jgi:hypothetical protein